MRKQVSLMPLRSGWLRAALITAATLGGALLLSCGRSDPATVYSAVGGNTGSFSGPISGDAIQVLSNRADLISGGDALVEVALPEGVSASAVTIDLNGVDVTPQFGISADGRYMGLVDGLVLGVNQLTAHFPGGSSSSYAIVNHPQGGPLIAGPQLQPWTCLNAAATDAQCNQPAEYSFVYKSIDPTKTDLQPYDLNNPPSDVATTTTENGTTLPFIVRIETGYQDRDQYKIAALFQPGQPWTALAPQPQFNRKLLITHGVLCGVEYQTGNAPSVTSYNPADATGAGIPAVGDNSVAIALGAGFAVMSTALNFSIHNCNLPLQAESMLMAKEHLIEHYGTLRYTIGTGCSGGSLTQQWVANAYPGIYQGILPTCSFPDTWSQATQILDYHLTLAYFQDPSKWALGVIWSPTQMADVQGHTSIVNSQVSDNALFHAVIPSNPCGGISDAQRYDAATNPGGVRCSVIDAAINVFGPREPAVWSPNEQSLNRGFGGIPADNVGVQYGLSVLQAGTITPAQFIDLNTKIGGLSVDMDLIPTRLEANQPALANAYRSGLINGGNNLDSTAIIDCRGPDPGIFHDSYRAFAMRARLDREHGHHDNHVIWTGLAPVIGDSECATNSLKAMDRWLAAVESDSSTKTLPQKISSNKPSDVADACWDGLGAVSAPGLCPSATQPGECTPGMALNNAAVVPVYCTPRMVAGDQITVDTNKCELKPLNRADNYGPLGFSDAQWAQMQALFPDGVCDFSKPGVSQQGTVAWQTYQDASGDVIYGGAPLPQAPEQSGTGWAAPAFGVFTATR